MGKEIRVEGREGNKINGRIYIPELNFIHATETCKYSKCISRQFPEHFAEQALS